MGDIPLAIKDWDQVEQNPFFCPDPDKIDALDELMRGLKKEGDSIGAKVTVVADGVPPGSVSRSSTAWMPISPTR